MRQLVELINRIFVKMFLFVFYVFAVGLFWAITRLFKVVFWSKGEKRGFIDSENPKITKEFLRSGY